MFVHCQCHVTGPKSEQRHSPLKFAGFRTQFTLLTLVQRKDFMRLDKMAESKESSAGSSVGKVIVR